MAELPTLATSSHRRTVALKLTPAISGVLSALSSSRLAPVIAATLGEDAALCELYCHLSAPGAQKEAPYAVAADAPTSGEPGASRLVVMVALNTIEYAMGPPLVWPRTHTPRSSLSLFEYRYVRSDAYIKPYPHSPALGLSTYTSHMHDTSSML